MVVRFEATGRRPWCNVRVYALSRDRKRRRLVREEHNLITTAGLNQLRAAAQGDVWYIGSIGLGSSGTAAQASDTWGLSPLLVTAPTNTLRRGASARFYLQLEEDELVGQTIREIWLSQTTDAPPAGPAAYMRATIPALNKDDESAYLFVVECSWGGSCCKGAWYMFAALAVSNGAYTYVVDQLYCGSGSRVRSVTDTGLDEPWAMTPIGSPSVDVTVNGKLGLAWGIPPDAYTGLVLREAGVFYRANTGTGPLTVPALFTRVVRASDYVMVEGSGARVSCPIYWTSG